jgi:hypothetical protein
MMAWSCVHIKQYKLFSPVEQITLKGTAQIKGIQKWHQWLTLFEINYLNIKTIRVIM